MLHRVLSIPYQVCPYPRRAPGTYGNSPSTNHTTFTSFQAGSSVLLSKINYSSTSSSSSDKSRFDLERFESTRFQTNPKQFLGVNTSPFEPFPSLEGAKTHPCPPSLILEISPFFVLKGPSKTSTRAPTPSKVGLKKKRGNARRTEHNTAARDENVLRSIQISTTTRHATHTEHHIVETEEHIFRRMPADIYTRFPSGTCVGERRKN